MSHSRNAAIMAIFWYRPHIARGERRIEVKFNTSVAVKAGMYGAIAGLVVALVGRIPFINCLIGPLAWVVAVGTGVLYTHFALAEGNKVELVEGGVGGAVAGAIAGAVNSLISGLLTLIFGAVGAAADLLGGDAGAAAATAVFSIGGVILGIIVGAIVGAVLGAIGGAVYAAIKGKSS